MALLKDWPEEERPRERMQKYGVKALSNSELLAILLRTGTKEHNVKYLADSILSNFNSIKEFKNISLPELLKIKGLGLAKSANLLAALELGKRVYDENAPSFKLKITNSEDAYRHFSTLIKDELQENFLVIYLDNHERYITHKILFVGTIDKSIINPREVVKQALLINASLIIIMHNHPSGIVTPSKSDDEATVSIINASNLFNITLLDHIIVGGNKYYSYLEEKRIQHA